MFSFSFWQRPSGLGYAEDYAFFIAGLLDLFSVSWDAQWLQWALQLQAKQDELFWDASELCAERGSRSGLLTRTQSRARAAISTRLAATPACCCA